MTNAKPTILQFTLNQYSAPEHFMWHSCSVTGYAVRQIHHAQRELATARESNDLIVEAYGSYGLAEGLARIGRVEESMQLAEKSIIPLENLGSWSEAIARHQHAKVLIQAGEYASATEEARRAVDQCWRLRLMELTSPAFPLLVEAGCGKAWYSLENEASRKVLQATRFIAPLARLLGLAFPNIRAHALRVSGRRAQVKGKTKRAVRFFDRAIRSAERIGAEYERARALLDKSMVLPPGAERDHDRQRGLELLESLGCVLPEAEVEYLSIDREAHHARAAEARARHESELKNQAPGRG